ncbi:hypothetical protein WG947_15780 [Pontibacter sp. H259]|uniref:hypothetical protein n=1 Tax=Pontibacter sp. H259 TaxID=3133421 RepID=UPI0030BC8FBD
MKKYLLVALLAGVSIFTSCTVAQMAVTPDFMEQAEELPIEGRSMVKPNGSFTIGNYTVANRKRGWVQKSGFSIFGYHDQEATQKHHFSLQNAQGNIWYIFAASYLGITSLQDGKGLTIELSPNMEYYASQFTSPQSGTWRLVTIDPRHYFERKKFTGELSNGTNTFKIEPVYSFKGSKFPTSDVLGYEFKDATGVVGAVQVINNGKVWIKPGLDADTHMVLTSAMASLLLYEKLEQTIEND